MGYRVIVEPKELRMRLRAEATSSSMPAPNSGGGSSASKKSPLETTTTVNPEPFFVSLALFDARRGVKLTENFYFDPNPPEIRRMIPPDVHRFNGPAHNNGVNVMASKRSSIASSASSVLTAPPSTASTRKKAAAPPPPSPSPLLTPTPGSVKKPSPMTDEAAENDEENEDDDDDDAASTVTTSESRQRHSRLITASTSESDSGVGNSGVGNYSNYANSRYAPRLVDPLLHHLLTQHSSSPSPSIETRMSWVREPQRAVFNLSRPHPDVFLVVRVEKVLQGALSKCLEPYLKGDALKSGNKVRKQMKEMCTRIGELKKRWEGGDGPWGWTKLLGLSDSFGDSCNSLTKGTIALFIRFVKQQEFGSLHLFPFFTPPSLRLKQATTACRLLGAFTRFSTPLRAITTTPTTPAAPPPLRTFPFRSIAKRPPSFPTTRCSNSWPIYEISRKKWRKN